MQPQRRLIHAGAILMLCSCASLMRAQTNTQINSTSLESGEMADKVVKNQREAILAMMEKAMSILRDHKPFNPVDSEFGVVQPVEKTTDSTDERYMFRNSILKGVDIVFITSADPLDYSDDRGKTPIVPGGFDLQFASSPVRIDILPSLIKERLDLADYWIAGDGKKYDGNDLGSGAPPSPLLHRYRYRAKEHLDSRFPVDVELLYGDADPTDSTDTRVILHVTLSRAYPYLTPEMRKQKREEKEQRMHDLHSNPGATK